MCSHTTALPYDTTNRPPGINNPKDGFYIFYSLTNSTPIVFAPQLLVIVAEAFVSHTSSNGQLFLTCALIFERLLTEQVEYVINALFLFIRSGLRSSLRIYLNTALS